jgi:hypothetical protein
MLNTRSKLSYAYLIKTMNKEVKHILKLAVFRYDAADDAHRTELLSMLGARYFVNLAETPQRLADFETAARIFLRYIKLYY